MGWCIVFINQIRFKLCVCVRICVRVCFVRGKGMGTPHMHGLKESFKYLNLKMLTTDWDSNPRPHGY